MVQLLIFDADAGRGCTGNCCRIESLALDALAPTQVRVTRVEGLLDRAALAGADVVVVRTAATRPLADVVAPLRDACGNASILGALCDEGPLLPDLVSSLSRGVDDFLCCPFSTVELAARLLRLVPAERAPRLERAALLGGTQLDALVGDDTVFLRAVSRIARVASSSATVLIHGETGVGKNLFAHAIHYNGTRRVGPFVSVNCSALPDHLFENELFGHCRGAYTDAGAAQRGIVAEAEGGTLFLDEVDTLSAGAQAKLLRLLQDREYRPLGSGKTLTADIRVIAATNADLRSLVAARRFRQDLFHRLDVLSLDVPPLRERTSDIPLLAQHFLDRYACQYGRSDIRITPMALRKLVAHAWPGNVRELESVLHRAVVLNATEVVDAADVELPGESASGDAAPSSGARRAMEEFERGYLRKLLADHHGNVSRAALASGNDRRTLQRRLRRHGILRSSFEDEP